MLTLHYSPSYAEVCVYCTALHCTETQHRTKGYIYHMNTLKLQNCSPVQGWSCGQPYFLCMCAEGKIHLTLSIR